MGRVSHYDGKTWQTPYVLGEMPERRSYMLLVGFMRSRTGRFHAFFLRISHIDMEKHITKGDIWHMRMDDVERPRNADTAGGRPRGDGLEQLPGHAPPRQILQLCPPVPPRGRFRRRPAHHQGARTIVKKQAGDPDRVLNCYPFANAAGGADVFLRPFAVHTRDGETFQEPTGMLLRPNPSSLLGTGMDERFADGAPNWVTDYENTTAGGGRLTIRAGGGIGYACLNFPFGTSGTIEVEYSGAAPDGLGFLLAPCYLDRCNFEDTETAGGHRESLMEHCTALEVKAGALAGQPLAISWAKAGDVLLTAGDYIAKATVKGGAAGFNHFYVILRGGSFALTRVTVTTEGALETGIEY